MKVRRLPAATVARLPIYVHSLESLAREGVTLISSQKLSEATGVDAAQIRRDLSYLGALGTPGVGYDVAALLGEISHYLGMSRTWRVVLVGYGKLGSALAAYAGFSEQNYRIAAIFDADPATVGIWVDSLEVLPIALIPEVVPALNIDIGIIATPASAAQEVADSLAASGVTSILNFAPTTLVVPRGVTVRNIDVAAEMQILSFHETMKDTPETCYPFRAAMEQRVSQYLRGRL